MTMEKGFVKEMSFKSQIKIGFLTCDTGFKPVRLTDSCDTVEKFFVQVIFASNFKMRH